VHTGSRARNHLLALAQTTVIRLRVDERITWSAGVRCRQEVGGFSLGRVRWALVCPGWATSCVVLERAGQRAGPGVLWIRNLLKGLAAEGAPVVSLAADE